MTARKHKHLPPRIQDIAGKRVGRLTVESFSHVKNGYSFWTCRCDCGTVKTIRQNQLAPSQKTVSCGCRQQETLALRQTHGEAGKRTKEYACWEGMITRCQRQRGAHVRRYFGRGITVCERWRNSFENFLEDMGRAPSEEHSIDRIDNDGNYEPSNCRWATMKEQLRNTSRNRILEIDGVSKTLAEWAEFGLVKYNTILYRLRRGWSEKDAVFSSQMKGVRGMKIKVQQ